MIDSDVLRIAIRGAEFSQRIADHRNQSGLQVGTKMGTQFFNNRRPLDVLFRGLFGNRWQRRFCSHLRNAESARRLWNCSIHCMCAARLRGLHFRFVSQLCPPDVFAGGGGGGD